MLARLMAPAPTDDRTRAVMRFILAAFYLAAGVAHLRVPEKLLAITPSWVPFATEIILITGVCEVAGAIALVTRPLRWWAGIAFGSMHCACGRRTSSTPSTASTCRPSPIAGSTMDRGWRFSPSSSGGRCTAPV